MRYAGQELPHGTYILRRQHKTVKKSQTSALQKKKYKKKTSRKPLTVDRVAEDDGLVHLQLGEERVEAVHFLALRHEGVKLGNTLIQMTK